VDVRHIEAIVINKLFRQKSAFRNLFLELLYLPIAQIDTLIRVTATPLNGITRYCVKVAVSAHVEYHEHKCLVGEAVNVGADL
jgi:hypothetical protein